MQKKLFSLQKGFTLVEMLAVIIVLVTVGGIVFGVLFASLRGSNRATLLSDVQDNGDYALTEMARVIRFSQAVVTPDSCVLGPTPTPISTTSITVRNVDRSLVTYSCTTGSNGTIASNGANLIDTRAVKVTSCSFTCSQNSIYEAPTIGISFTLNKKVTSSNVDSNAPVVFQTTVNLRNKIQ